MKKWIKCNFTIKWSGYYVKYLWDETSYWQAIWKGKTIDSIDWIYIFINFMVDTKKNRQQKQSYTRSHADRRFSYLLWDHSFSPNCQTIFPFYSIQQRTPWFENGKQRTLILPTSVFFFRGPCLLCFCFFFTSDLWFKTLFVCSTCHAKKC